MNRTGQLDVSEALREKAKGNSAMYRLMVQDISNGARLGAWLSNLTKSVTDISDTHYELLSALLSFDWFTRVPSEVASYTEFLKHLTFAKPHFFEQIYQSMVVHFRGPTKASSAVMEKSELSEMDYEASMESIHRAIKTLLKAHPTSVSVLRNAVCDKFPHKVFPVAAQSSYIKQLLQLTSYLPSLRKDVLELIIDRIVQIDVELKTEIRRAPKPVELASSEEMFHFEADPSAVHPKHFEMDEQEDKIDTMLCDVLNWLVSLAPTGVEEMARLDVLNDTFNILVGAYDRLLLTTTQTKYAQWTLFYICSLQEEYSMRLFDHLFNIVSNPRYPPQQRQRACMYIASHAARAKYIPTSMAQSVLEYMCSWMTEYITLAVTDASNGSGSVAPDASTHVLFYALFHGLAYILRLQHQNLFEDTAAKLTIEELGIPAIVESGFNPLKVCSSALVASFVEIMAQYGVYFTKTLQENEKLVLPARDVFGPLSLLTDFFPYDPYLLRRSSAFLLPLYIFPEQQGKLNPQTNTFETGYATEGETELDMDLRPDREHEDMDEDDAHTTESMLAMMDFGRPAPVKKTSSNDGLFGSFDEKSSISSGQGSSYSQASGTFPQQGFGMAFGVPCASPASSYMSASPLRGPSPATDPGFFPGSFEPRRSGSKRARDDNWQPSTPLSTAIFTPTASKPSNPFSIGVSPSTSSVSPSSWGGASVHNNMEN